MPASQNAATIKNTNKWSTRQLVTMALMCAVSALFSFVQIPLFPPAPFLTYDPSLVPAMVCGFVFRDRPRHKARQVDRLPRAEP